MDTIAAIQQRHSVRAFLDKAVSQQHVTDLLNIAAHAPSGANTQPWQVAVVTGTSKQTLTKAIISAFESGQPSQPDYRYYPDKWLSPYIERRRQCGLQLYQSLGIERKDKAAQQAQWAANYQGFNAPMILFFFMDEAMQTGSFLDFGMFLQSLMLAAESEGLATCPQAALAEYPAIVKSHLDYPDNTILLCGMAIGYEDKAAAVNQYRTERETAVNFTRFYQ